MDEATKTRDLRGDLERSVLVGKGIDIGCGPDPVTPDVRRFDIEDGDANVISQFVHEQFDFVYSSHCLEHMHNPKIALLEWWKLVRPGGHLIFYVPDEDLYEQGVFPSRFNSDHKATFTISKAKSWSPVSHNVLDLAQSLPNGQLISLVLQDQGYDRRLLHHGPNGWNEEPWRLILRTARKLSEWGNGLLGQEKKPSELLPNFTQDQLTSMQVVAQIQCIVKKLA